MTSHIPCAAAVAAAFFCTFRPKIFRKGIYIRPRIVYNMLWKSIAG